MSYLKTFIQAWLVFYVCAPVAYAEDYHVIAIRDIDDDTPIAGAKISTKHHLTLTSDDYGVVGFYEPAMMDQIIYVTFEREGYELVGAHWNNGKQIRTDTGAFSVVYARKIGEAPTARPSTREYDHIMGHLPKRNDYHEIQFVDAQTDKGIPLVSLKIDDQEYVSDSFGRIAFYESKYMGDTVEVQLHSHGYDAPKTLTIQPTTGGLQELVLERQNIAQREYRVTGTGIYADSVLLGYETPLDNPLDNGRLAGQDTVMVTPYQGELFWIWGDTLNLDTAFGNFRVAGATSPLPVSGRGLPNGGINFKYFENKDGFTAEMAPDSTVPGEGATWIGQLITLPDAQGVERLYAHYGRWAKGMNMTEHGIVTYNDNDLVFEEVIDWGTEYPRLLGTPNRLHVDGNDYLYMGYNVRMRADLDALVDPTQWEVFTPLNAEGAIEEVGADGRPRYRWVAGGSVPDLENVFWGTIQANQLLQGSLTDIRTGTPFSGRLDILNYNPHRKRWVAIIQEKWGTGPSFAGEVWYAEADTPMGPWTYGTKIVTHDNYTFYNVQLHPWFNRDGGQVVHFEGTYTKWLTDNTPTPRYNYNQIMYSLDLDDERLSLPTPVYAVGYPETAPALVTRDRLTHTMTTAEVAFMAPDRPHPLATMPVYWLGDQCQGYTLQLGGDADVSPDFYLVEPDAVEELGQEGVFADLIPLYEGVDPETGLDTLHTVGDSIPVGYAWRSKLDITFPVAQHLGPVYAHAGQDHCLAEAHFGDGVEVQLDASQHSVGTELQYQWSWPGGTSEQSNPTAWLPAGVHQVELLVINRDGYSDRDTLTIHVAEGEPVDIDPNAPPAESGCSGCSATGALPGAGGVLMLLTALVPALRRRSHSWRSMATIR